VREEIEAANHAMVVEGRPGATQVLDDALLM
jgi:hypothetical protein